MNLSPQQLSRLNQLLAAHTKIPQGRKEVSPTGNNYKWLQKAYLGLDPDSPNKELCQRLGITSRDVKRFNSLKELEAARGAEACQTTTEQPT